MHRLYLAISRPGKERWRVLVPLSEKHAPEARAGMAARLNGVVGGMLTRESFVLSQAFYYGSVDDNPHHRVKLFGGDFLNLRDDLYAGSIFKDGSKVGEQGTGGANGASPGRATRARSEVPREAKLAPDPVERVRFALDAFSSNCSRMEWLKVAAALRDEYGEDGFDLFDSWSAKAEGGTASDGSPMYTRPKLVISEEPS